MGRKRRESIRDGETNPTHPEDGSEDPLLERIRQLEEENKRLEKEKERLNEENKILRSYLESIGMNIEELIEDHKTRTVSKNSSNSSKPPSCDVYVKPNPRSLRRRTGRRPGGQVGHKGHNIILPHEPDESIDHLPAACIGCPRCQQCSSEGAFTCAESRYVLEAVTYTKVVEHRAMRAECPMKDSGKEPETGSFPKGVEAHIQYGDSFGVIATVLSTYGAMSDLRNSETIGQLFDVSLSPGTVVSMVERCAERAEPIMEIIRKRIQ